MFSTSNVKSTLLCGPAELSKSFMFEAAIYWAEEGHRVVYITPAPLDSLPAACHDRSNPAPAAFKLMRFITGSNADGKINNRTRIVANQLLPPSIVYFSNGASGERGKFLVLISSFLLKPSCATSDTCFYNRDISLDEIFVAYLENYEALVQRLTELHTFAILPSILLIDDFDAYIKDYEKTESMHDMHIAKTCALILDTMNSCSRILKNTVYACVWSTLATTDMRIYSMYFADAWIATNEEETKTILLEKHGHRWSSGKPTSYRYCKLQDGSRALKEIFC